MIDIKSLRASRIEAIGISIAIFFSGSLLGVAHGQVAGRNEETFERNRQTLQEMEVPRFIELVNRLHGPYQLAVELDSEQSKKLEELVSTVIQHYFRSDDFKIGLSRIGEQVAYRREFGKIIDEADLELQQSQIEQIGKWQNQLQEILLPHQFEMLNLAIVRETAMKKNPAFGSLGVALGLSDKLDLDEKQRKLLQEATEKAVQQYRAEAAELNKKGWQEVLAVLPEEKRKKLEELVGDLATETQFNVNSR
jgi:hypothetical protein